MSSQEVQSSYSGGKKALVIAAGVLALAGGVLACQETRAPAESGAKPPVVLEPTVVPVEPFVLNLADPEGDRYFRLTLQLVLDQRAVAERAAGGLAQAKLRDRIFALLSKKRVAQVTTVEGKELLRTELRETTGPLFATPPFHDAEHDPAPAHVLDVLFTEFLVQ
ncbi:MAG: flagellar basal body-associated FliL family protein [Planctomycetes bacterium]|nr:flagellar basal body-associated FliL family protein [Planctomycetota bacterium]